MYLEFGGYLMGFRGILSDLKGFKGIFKDFKGFQHLCTLVDFQVFKGF